LSLQPDHLETPPRRRRKPAPRRRISYIRLAAVAFCLLVWIAVARACMAAF
jgi:hypothetical protein